METTLIVGNSQAGVQTAESLRGRGYTGRIVLAGEEPGLPYQRPPLSKEYLRADMELAFRAPEFHAARGIELVAGDRVVGLERTAGGGGVATTAAGDTYPYARLVLATGAEPRRLEVPGSGLAGVGYLRTRADAARIRARLADARTVVVIGGGFIGLEMAAEARSRGLEVTVLEASGRLIGRAVGETTSAFFLRAHRDQGTRVVLNARLRRFTGADGTVTAVELDDGTLVPADLVVIGIGVLPRTELAEQLGLAVDNGIVVDGSGLASDGETLAVGDCASIPVPDYLPGQEAGPAGRIRLESVPNAVEQGRIAAGTLLGLPERYSALPWFWSTQGGLKLQIAGLSGGYTSEVVREVPGSGKFSVLYYRGGQLLAADCVNSPADFAAARSALIQGRNIAPGPAVDPAVPLKQCLEPAPAAV